MLPIWNSRSAAPSRSRRSIETCAQQRRRCPFRLAGCRELFRRRGALGAAQFGEVVAAGEEGLDVARCLAQALAVLDERDAHEALAVLAKADPRRDRDIGAFEQKLREGERTDAAEFLRD